MKKGLSRAELKAAKNILKKLLEKSEFYRNDEPQVEVVIGMIDHIEKCGDWNTESQTSISKFAKYSTLTNSELTATLHGMAINFGGIYVSTTLGLETFGWTYEIVSALAIYFLKKTCVKITNILRECAPNNEGASYYRATWSKLAQKIDAEKALEREIEEYAVSEEAQEVATQAEIENAVAEKVKQIELESCLWWINKTAELVAETRKEIEKENLTLARIKARWAVNGILTEYVRTILGKKGFVGTYFDNSRCCFFPQIKCRASYHKELADSALIFGVNEIYAWVKDYGDGGIHIHGIQEDGGEGWGSTIDLADYENLQQLDAALQIIKARIKKPRNGYVVDVPEVKEAQAEIGNAAENVPLYVDEVAFKTFGLSCKIDRKGRVTYYIDGERKSKEDAEQIYNARYEIAVNSTIEKKIRRQLLIVKGCNEETDLAKSQIEKIEAQDGVPTENMKYREYLYWKEDSVECTAKKTAALKQLDELQAKYPQAFSEVIATFQSTYYFEPAEYAITPEAFEVAVQAEISNAAFQFDLQAANDVEENEEPEKFFVAYVSRFDGWSYHRKGEKFFKNAADAFNYLQKKHYKNDNFELVVESWDSEEDYNKYTDCHSLAEEHIIYKNSPDFGEETASAEIQKLIEERDAKAATDKIAEEKALAEEKARKEKLKQAATTCKALYDDWSKAKKRLVDLRRYREQCKDAAKKAAYDLKIAEFEKTFKPLDDEYNAAWDILIHSKANDFEAEI